VARNRWRYHTLHLPPRLGYPTQSPPSNHTDIKPMILLSRLSRAIAVLLLSFVVTISAAAQEANPSKTRAELGASVFFGNTSQIAVTTAATTERSSNDLGFVSRMSYTYGEATDLDGKTTVNKRSWNVGTDLNLYPERPVNAFISGKVESVFEKKIDLRWNVGGGARVQFFRGPTGGAEFSVAVVAERTIPRREVGQAAVTVAKWSSRVRLTRELAEGRITFQFDTTYEPEWRDLGTFTLGLSNSLAFQLTEGLALQVSVKDSYDSQAVSRGARTNNDGQLFFSVVSTF
jgi:Protein of unknown function, DUF481